MKEFFMVCLRYGPAHWQHMKSFASCLRDRNYNVRLILSKTFQWMNHDFSDVTSYLTDSDKSFISVIRDMFHFFPYTWYLCVRILRKQKPCAVLFASSHPLNYFIAKIVKNMYPDCYMCFWMHEPYKEDKSQYKRKALAITAMEYVQEKLLPLIDVVILHSRRGNNAFRIRYPDFKGVVKLIPLGYRDECKMKQHESRIYDITFFGGAVKAKGIDDFFEFLKKSQELNSGLKFQLVTPSRIDRYLSRLGPNWEKWLKVVNKPTISDEEIREACAKTYAVIASYRETTQSGAIPVAFMNGTPVIATDIEGLYEYITDKVNGVYIPKNFSYSDVVSALNYIKANFSEMSKNARKSFVEIWSDGNWDKYYGWLVEMLNCKT